MYSFFKPELHGYIPGNVLRHSSEWARLLCEGDNLYIAIISEKPLMDLEESNVVLTRYEGEDNLLECQIDGGVDNSVVFDVRHIGNLDNMDIESFRETRSIEVWVYFEPVSKMSEEVFFDRMIDHYAPLLIDQDMIMGDLEDNSEYVRDVIRDYLMDGSISFVDFHIKNETQIGFQRSVLPFTINEVSIE